MVRELESWVEEMRRDHDEAISDAFWSGEAAMKKRADDIRAQSEEARRQLTEMEKRTEEYEEYLQERSSSRSQTGAAIKMRRNQAAALTRKLEEVTSRFLDQETSFKETREQDFANKYRVVVNRDASDEEVQTGGRTQLFARNRRCSLVLGVCPQRETSRRACSRSTVRIWSVPGLPSRRWRTSTATCGGRRRTSASSVSYISSCTLWYTAHPA